MDFVSGIGGVFICSNDPGALARWYETILGLQFEHFPDSETYYITFYGLDPADHNAKLDTSFAIMKSKVPLPVQAHSEEPDDMYGDQPFMLNFRVWDLDSTLARLSDNGVDIINRQDEEYGNFAWVRDADGNRIELYEPLHQSAAQ